MNEYIAIKRVLSLTLLTWLVISCTNSTIKNSTSNNSEAIYLPDGTFALLNKNSSIEFNQNSDERTVKQTGEIFYIVKKGEIPFSVVTEKGEIEVVGTEFNVKSSDKELDIEVEKGIVKLKVNKFVKELKKGQKAFLKDIEQGIVIGKAEFKHKKWTKKLEYDLKKLSREIKKSSKQIEKGSKKIGNDLTRELKKLNK